MVSENTEQGLSTEDAENLDEGQQEERHAGFIRLDKHDKDIGVQHKKYREEERGKKKAQASLADLQKQFDELKKTATAVEVKPIDPFSETLTQDLEERDKAVKHQALQEAEQTQTETAARNKAASLAEAKQQADDTLQTEFNAKTLALGLDVNDVNATLGILHGTGVSDVIADAIVDRPDGALFAKYLESNLVSLDEMNKMSAFQLFSHIDSELKDKLAAFKPKTSGAPDPPMTLKGGGVSELDQREDWEKGAVYE